MARMARDVNEVLLLRSVGPLTRNFSNYAALELLFIGDTLVSSHKDVARQHKC